VTVNKYFSFSLILAILILVILNIFDNTFSGGPSTRQIGERHPFARFFSLFSSAETRKRGYIASNRPRKSFFNHNRHPLTGFLEPPLNICNTKSNCLYMIDVLFLVEKVYCNNLERKNLERR
jgi:hypothetical protein